MNHEERIMREWLREMTSEKETTVREAVNNFLEAYFTLEDMWKEGKLSNTGYPLPVAHLAPLIKRIEEIYDDSCGE